MVTIKNNIKVISLYTKWYNYSIKLINNVNSIVLIVQSFFVDLELVSIL